MCLYTFVELKFLVMEACDVNEECSSSYVNSCEAKPFKQGAEARLYRCLYFGRPAILKERFPKKYR